MEVHPLMELFTGMIQDVYYAEKHLTRTLPRMSKAATTDELRDAFDEHLAQTEEHVFRLEKIFDLLERGMILGRCPAMDGLSKEVDHRIADTEAGSLTRDVGLIATAQNIEHYEIATYGTLVQLAANMHQNEVVSLLEETLKEEKSADMVLTAIAEHSVNWQALENE